MLSMAPRSLRAALGVNMVWWAHCVRTTPTIGVGTLKQLDSLGKPPTGLEPVTSPLPRVCSTTELRWRSRLLSGEGPTKNRPNEADCEWYRFLHGAQARIPVPRSIHTALSVLKRGFREDPRRCVANVCAPLFHDRSIQCRKNDFSVNHRCF